VFAHHPGQTPASSAKSRSRSGGLINSPTGATLGQGRLIGGISARHLRFNSLPARDAHELHHEDRDVHGKNHEESYGAELAYGLTEDLDLSLSIPVVSKTSIQIDNHANLGRGERSAGLGDLWLQGKYRVVKGRPDVAVLFGVKAPTGSTSETDQSGQKFEIEQQPGSGSWDLAVGIAASRQVAPETLIGASVEYMYRGEGGQQRKLGDVLRNSIGVSHALPRLGRWPALHAVLELNTEWAAQDHSRDERHVLDSGGVAVFLTPGIRAGLSDNASAYFAMPVPVYQNLGGEHEESTYGLITGLVWTF
jgi:hypothetical protein